MAMLMILILDYTGNVKLVVSYLVTHINIYSFVLWDTITGGSIQVPPCGPTVAGAALYFSNITGSQLSLTKALDLNGVRFVSLLHMI